MTVLSTGIMFLNIASGIVGGIWLAILGHWGLIIYGVVLGVVMPWVYSITLLPSMGIMLLVNYFQKRKNIFLVSIFGYLGSLFSNLIIALWVYFVYVSFLNMANLASIIPVLLFAYSTMLSPLSYMARKEGPESFGSILGVLLAIVCYFAFFIIGLFGYPSFLHLVLISAVFSFITMTIISPSIASEMKQNAEESFEKEPQKYEYLLKDALVTYESLNLNYKVPVCLGIDEEGKEHFADLVDLKHILMGGQTGSGKSIFAHSLINSLLLRFSPEDLKLLLVDMKRVEFTQYNGLPHMITDCLVDSSLVIKWLGEVLDEKKKSKNIKPYNLIIIDTSSDIMLNNYRNDFMNLINEILVSGPSLGIFLVMYDSRVGEEVFPLSFVSGFNTIICFATADKAGSEILINSGDGVNLLGRGDMLLLKKDQLFSTHLQAPFISDNEIKETIDTLK